MYQQETTEAEEIARTRIPKKGEVLGMAITMLGAGKIMVKCEDGFTRICRIDGKIRKKLWIRVGDIVLIELWPVQMNERGDVVWIYTRTQASWLKKKGFLKKAL